MPKQDRTHPYYHPEVTRLEIARKFYSFRLLNTPRSLRVVAWGVVGFFGIGLLTLFLPWQQNIRATGSVTTLFPNERPQQLNTAIGGLILRWHVREGQFVRKGDTLVEITEVKEKYFDPQLLLRTREQVNAQEETQRFMAEKINAQAEQLNALRDGMTNKLKEGENKILQAQYKLSIDSAEYVIAQEQFARYEALYAQGLISLTDFEKRKLKLQETRNKRDASRQDLATARIQQATVRADYMDKISKTLSERNDAASKLSEGDGKLSKLQNEYANLEIRSGFYAIRAPQDGIVVRTLKAGIGENVKEGEAVATIMPASYHQAVELLVSATDVPLLSVGRKVRLEFDGWPALQVSGWPSVSVGTFGGIIAVVDVVDDGMGKYRILVKPDPADDPWPRKLRMGSGVYGWAMLDEVPIWYEIWRQFNGFPPSLAYDPDGPVQKGNDKVKK
ncbi:MAG: HlyD family efflux transporter periplasmic adaptor subunit [Bacteroidetes bacterium]|nr:HlyD family efflux transporter periplasmic adaptor subunit [Bacteroidota bacterium]